MSNGIILWSTKKDGGDSILLLMLSLKLHACVCARARVYQDSRVSNYMDVFVYMSHRFKYLIS